MYLFVLLINLSKTQSMSVAGICSSTSIHRTKSYFLSSFKYDLSDNLYQYPLPKALSKIDF